LETEDLGVKLELKATRLLRLTRYDPEVEINKSVDWQAFKS